MKCDILFKSLCLTAVAALAAFFPGHASAAVIASWNFESDAIAVNNNPPADFGTGTASSIGMDVYPTPNIGVTTDDVTLGATGDTGTNGQADLGQIWRIRAQAGTMGAANGWSSLAPIGTQGTVFAVPTTGYTSGVINVGFDWYSTTQGEAKLAIEYTNDGVNWTDVPVTIPAGTTQIANEFGNLSDTNTIDGPYLWGSNGSQGQNWFQGLSATIDDPLALNNPLFAIEMVNAATGVDDISVKGTALNNNSGNWRFDNISVSVTPVPEPSSLVLAGLGCCLAGVVALRRKK